MTTRPTIRLWACQECGAAFLHREHPTCPGCGGRIYLTDFEVSRAENPDDILAEIDELNRETSETLDRIERKVRSGRRG